MLERRILLSVPISILLLPCSVWLLFHINSIFNCRRNYLFCLWIRFKAQPNKHFEWQPTYTPSILLSCLCIFPCFYLHPPSLSLCPHWPQCCHIHTQIQYFWYGDLDSLSFIWDYLRLLILLHRPCWPCKNIIYNLPQILNTLPPPPPLIYLWNLSRLILPWPSVRSIHHPWCYL